MTMGPDSTPPQVETIKVGDEQGRGGLYNMVIPGGFERAAILLPLIQINPDAGSHFRLRDAWIERGADGLEVHVYTRVGGNNRVPYAKIIDVLRGTEHYLRDADDSYDSTYASFWFKVPERFVAHVEHLALDPVDTGRRWEKMLSERWENTVKKQ